MGLSTGSQQRSSSTSAIRAAGLPERPRSHLWVRQTAGTRRPLHFPLPCCMPHRMRLQLASIHADACMTAAGTLHPIMRIYITLMRPVGSPQTSRWICQSSAGVPTPVRRWADAQIIACAHCMHCRPALPSLFTSAHSHAGSTVYDYLHLLQADTKVTIPVPPAGAAPRPVPYLLKLPAAAAQLPRAALKATQRGSSSSDTVQWQESLTASAAWAAGRCDIDLDAAGTMMHPPEQRPVLAQDVDNSSGIRCTLRHACRAYATSLCCCPCFM